MNRRRLLASLATAPVAGYVGRDRLAGRATTTTDATDTTTDAPSTTDTTTADTASPADESPVSVRGVTVAPELVASNSPDSLGTYGDRDDQFVVATVAVDGSASVAPGEFTLDAGGGTYAATTDVGYGHRLRDYGTPYGDSREGWLAFRLPNPVDADAAALTWPDGEHALGADARARLSRPPTTFEVREFAAPDAASVGDTVTARLTVANVGDADGTFVGALDRIGPVAAHAPEAAISLDVAAGATATWEFTHTLEHGDSDDLRMTLLLDWRDGGRSETVDVTNE